MLNIKYEYVAVQTINKKISQKLTSLMLMIAKTPNTSAIKLIVGGALIFLIKTLAHMKKYVVVKSTPLLKTMLRELDISYMRLTVKNKADEVKPCVSIIKILLLILNWVLIKIKLIKKAIWDTEE